MASVQFPQKEVETRSALPHGFIWLPYLLLQSWIFKATAKDQNGTIFFETALKWNTERLT
jgi:hypothetical protein